jgi:hypothetical protein
VGSIIDRDKTFITNQTNQTQGTESDHIRM